MTHTLRFFKQHPEAKLPKRSSDHAAGLDLYSIDDVTIDIGKRIAVRTGVSVEIPNGFYGRVAPRSGLAINNGIDVLAGVIDSDYRGEILCVLINHGEATFHIKAGSRVAQLILEAIITPEPEWADDLSPTMRGKAGFGSSGS